MLVATERSSCARSSSFRDFKMDGKRFVLCDFLPEPFRDKVLGTFADPPSGRLVVDGRPGIQEQPSAVFKDDPCGFVDKDLVDGMHGRFSRFLFMGMKHLSDGVNAELQNLFSCHSNNENNGETNGETKGNAPTTFPAGSDVKSRPGRFDRGS